MENFIAYNPTQLHFGKEVVNDLGKNIAKFGRKVLLIYGGGSIKKNGIYDAVNRQLHEANMEVVEYSGIRSNPRLSDVDAAAELGRKHQVDAILAVGGGSVIDTAKYVALGIPHDGSAWDFVIRKAKPQSAIPLLTVLTLAATGTEMNMFAVVQNMETQQKFGYGHPLMYPKHSFLDPAYTLSVPKDYTAFGVADLMAHALENWFGKAEASLTDRFIISIIKEAIEYGPQLLNDLKNEDLRARIMYASTMALNGLTSFGKGTGDWGVHSIGHVLSVLYDIPHGASLSIVFPAWMRFMQTTARERIVSLGHELFGVDSVEETVKELEHFFHKIQVPVKLSEYYPGYNRQTILQGMEQNKAGGYVYEIKKTDYPQLADLFI